MKITTVELQMTNDMSQDVDKTLSVLITAHDDESTHSQMIVSARKSTRIDCSLLLEIILKCTDEKRISRKLFEIDLENGSIKLAVIIKKISTTLPSCSEVFAIMLVIKCNTN